MTGKELRKNRGVISTQYFGLDKGECYNKEIRVKL